MTDTPPNGMPQFYPSLTYKDAIEAIAWLEKAFGFERIAVYAGEGYGARQVEHAELRFGSGILMTGSRRADLPATLQQTPYVYVADVDGHCTHARGAGARVTVEPHENDYGGRSYSVEDIEGNVWTFGSYVPEG